MSKILETTERTGDKTNSDFFESYLPKIYDRREAAGLDELLGNIRAFVIQIDHGDHLKYLMELYLMTPYRLHKAYVAETHKIFILQIKPEYPALIVIEPLTATYHDEFTAIDSLYPRAREKINAKYIGEIYHTQNLKETVGILSDQQIRFQPRSEVKNSFLSNKNFIFSNISYYTNNCVGYTDNEMVDFDAMGLGEPMDLTAEDHKQLEMANEVHYKFGLNELVFGVDHVATRVLSGEREDAILELLTMTNYYFWGAYNIEDMNSSTNICRNPKINYELFSPAKVFTANNTPFYVQSINKIPSPTEDFVRNFGKRLHHMAYEVKDGEKDGLKNIDYVVRQLASENVPFLAQVIGECRDFPDLKQIFSKSSNYSLLITEYVQRCQNFQGFFTKTNVAELTRAAGEDEKLKKADVFD